MLSWDCPQTPAGGAPPGLWEAPRKGVSRGNRGIKPQHPPERVCPVCASLRSGCSDRKFLLPGQPRHFLEGPTSFSQRPPSSGFTHNRPEVKALPEHTAQARPHCPSWTLPILPLCRATCSQTRGGKKTKSKGPRSANPGAAGSSSVPEISEFHLGPDSESQGLPWAGHRAPRLFPSFK